MREKGWWSVLSRRGGKGDKRQVRVGWVLVGVKWGLISIWGIIKGKLGIESRKVKALGILGKS